MAHEIETFSNGTAAAAFGKTPAWHRLGTVFQDNMTSEEALIAAQLAGWNVRLAPLQAIEITEDGVETAEANDRYATVRTHPITGKLDVLGVGLSGSYHPVQNEEQVAFMDALTDSARITSAGSLRGGRQTFFCCEIPYDLLVGGMDAVRLFLAIMNGHDGSMGFRAVVSPIRVVCANTQDMALATAQQRWSVAHTKNAGKAIEEARKTLNLTWKYVEAFEKAAQRMIDTRITNDKFEEIAKTLMGDPAEPGLKLSGVTMRTNKLQMVQTIYRSDTTRHVAGTTWGAYQAFAELADHKDGTLRGEQAEKRSLAAVDGSGVSLKENAYRLLSLV
jgi:phage/plasmid-like protein (TIGR03299 family)